MYVNVVLIASYLAVLTACIVTKRFRRGLHITLFALYTWNILHVFISPRKYPRVDDIQYVDSDFFGVIYVVILFVIFTLLSAQLYTKHRCLPYALSVTYLTWGLVWVSFFENDLIQRQIWYPTGLLLTVYLFCAFRRNQCPSREELRTPLLKQQGGPIVWEDEGEKTP